jgi:hypothetical protein
MQKLLHGKVRGRTIELSDDPGVADGEEVEIQITVVSPTAPKASRMTAGLAKIYEILGERYDSGFKDLAERHNEHQP